MASPTNTWQPLDAFVRWRNLTTNEEADGEIDRDHHLEENSLYSISISHPEQRSWKSPGAFKDVYEPMDDNAKVFESVVSDAILKVLQGGSCNFFAYGHTGSGKTHTIIGYEYDRDSGLELCLLAARKLFEALQILNKDKSAKEKLGVSFSLFEMRKNVAVDLLNCRTECHIRQGADGKTHIRGETEMLEDGKVRVKSIAKRPCWTFESLRDQLRQTLGLRTVGSSSVHDQSSRTHAILELEIVNIALVDARNALYDRRSELVPVGKRTTDILIEETMKSLVKDENGKWQPKPNHTKDQAKIDAAEAEKVKFEARVTAAEELIHSIVSGEDAPAPLGGKLVFVDLAGSEYQYDKGNVPAQFQKQTPRERQEGRQINTDLLALKEVIRACANNQERIPFRSSPLTMVPRDHFVGSKGGNSAMIVTASPAKEQYQATMNSLRYGSLVGAASA